MHKTTKKVDKATLDRRCKACYNFLWVVEMFFEKSDTSFEFLGIFKIERGASEQKTLLPRGYDSLSIRLCGSALFKTEQGDITVRPGDVLYIPQNATCYQRTEGETIFAIHFVNYSFDKSNQIEVLTVEDRNALEQIVQALYTAWKEQLQGYRFQCISLFYALLYELSAQAKRHTVTYERNKPLLRAIDYIHKNYRNGAISVSQLSKMCALSPTYFRRLFQEIYKTSPSQYILNLKLQYASYLLRSRLYSIREVSEKSGFGDEKYFSRIFKKNFGISPTKFRAIDPEQDWK